MVYQPEPILSSHPQLYFWPNVHKLDWLIMIIGKNMFPLVFIGKLPWLHLYKISNSICPCQRQRSPQQAWKSSWRMVLVDSWVISSSSAGILVFVLVHSNTRPIICSSLLVWFYKYDLGLGVHVEEYFGAIVLHRHRLHKYGGVGSQGTGSISVLGTKTKGRGTMRASD